MASQGPYGISQAQCPCGITGPVALWHHGPYGLGTGITGITRPVALWHHWPDGQFKGPRRPCLTGPLGSPPPHPFLQMVPMPIDTHCMRTRAKRTWAWLALVQGHDRCMAACASQPAACCSSSMLGGQAAPGVCGALIPQMSQASAPANIAMRLPGTDTK